MSSPIAIELLGKPNEHLRILAFGPGAFNAIPQLGAAHALMVSRGKPPDAVAGISTGAICAASLAEVVQAGDEVKQVARFRTILGNAESLAVDFRRQILPDMFEIHTQAPLLSPQLPIHTQ